VAGTLALLCAAGGVMGQTPSKEGSKPAAIVNGEIITMADLDAALKKNGPMAMPLSEMQRKQEQHIVLGALVQGALMRQFLKQNAPPIDEKELNRQMIDLVAGLKQQGKTLAEFCRELNQTEAQLRANAAAQLQWYAYARQRITEEQLEKCYQENKDLFDQVKVRASEIMFRLPSQCSEGDRAQARAQLAELRRKILNKEIDFAQAAKQYSHGPTKEQGGDLDWFFHLKGPLADLPESVVEAAFALQPEQISEVIDSEWGVHLIKVTGRDPGKPSEFAKVKEGVRQYCIEEMQQSILAQLRKSADIKIILP
jgi:peptidyl-prolyl cis-trans isomerase C